MAKFPPQTSMNLPSIITVQSLTNLQNFFNEVEFIKLSSMASESYVIAESSGIIN